MSKWYFRGLDGKLYVADDHTGPGALTILQQRLDTVMQKIQIKEGQMTTLEKIRAEIMGLKIQEGSPDYVRAMAELFSLKIKVLSIIDKYVEQEPTDRIEYGTDGNAYKLWMSNGKEFEQEPKWILVSERLPKSAGVYIVTREFTDGFECADLTDSCYFDGTSTWYDDNRINHGREYADKKIKAWMPLPKPYEPQESDDKEGARWTTS